MVFSREWRPSKTESDFFISAFYHWLLYCEAGKFSAELGTLEIFLVGTGLLGLLPL